MYGPFYFHSIHLVLSFSYFFNELYSFIVFLLYIFIFTATIISNCCQLFAFCICLCIAYRISLLCCTFTFIFLYKNIYVLCAISLYAWRSLVSTRDKNPSRFPRLLIVTDGRSGLTRASPSRSSWDPHKAVSLGLKGQASQRWDFSSKPYSLSVSIGMLLAVSVTHHTRRTIGKWRVSPTSLFSSTISGMNGPITLLYFSGERISREIKGKHDSASKSRAKSGNVDIAESIWNSPLEFVLEKRSAFIAYIEANIVKWENSRLRIKEVKIERNKLNHTHVESSAWCLNKMSLEFFRYFFF